MVRCAIVDISSGDVVNVIEYDEVPEGTPPGMDEGLIAITSDSAGPGFVYADGVFTDMRPSMLPPEMQKARDAEGTT